MELEYVLYAILCIVWIVALVYRRQITSLLLPIFLPLYLIRFEFGGIPIYFVEGLILIAAVPVFWEMIFPTSENREEESSLKKVFLLFNAMIGRKERPIKEFIGSIFFPISLFLVACFISTLIVPGDSYSHAMGILKSWVIIPILFFFVLYKNFKRNEDIEISMYAYSASALLLAFWGFYQAISGNYVTIDARISGPFESANYLAMYIAPVFVYLTTRFIQTFLSEKVETADMKWNALELRIYIAFMLFFLFIALILTQSYGGILAALGALFLYIIYERFNSNREKNKSFLNKLIVIIILIGFAGGVMAAALNLPKFQNLTKLNEHTSIGTRVEIWTVGVKLIQENPLFGIGLGEFAERYELQAEELLGKIPYEKVRLHSHNTLIETWLNSGLLGVISLTWIVVLTYMQIKKPASNYRRNLMLACLVMLTYIMLHGVLDVQIWKNDLALIFWLIIAAVFMQPSRY
ncbi:O-antigen ligase family protein [Patescibacteria group bacterium]|nr:O-antigen ligase family protein [Patescibacteria group bacterium]